MPVAGEGMITLSQPCIFERLCPGRPVPRAQAFAVTGQE